MAIRVVLLWHMHQPYYRDLVTGEYRLPWVRMHGLKDYYGMVKLLDEFPQVHQTFNLVPSLITQLQDYATGTARDPFLDVAATPAADLSLEQRQFALRYLFQANATHLIGRYPRYAELYERFRGTGMDAERAEPLFSAQDLTDLQILSQLAWFDEYFLAEPEIAALVSKGQDFNRDEQAFVIAKERELLARVVPAYRAAAAKGSAELSTSAFYHPILPLLCDTEVGGVSAPGLPLPQRPFRHPEDARAQLQRALLFHEQTFGVPARGVWPSEGSVSDEVLGIAHDLGVEWMATDEGVLGRSLGVAFARDGEGRLAPELAEKLYRCYRYERGAAHMNLLFRDHALSDLIGFVYSGMTAAQAAAHLVQRIKTAAERIDSKRDATVAIILDGENAWEYYPQSGREFLRRFYDAIAKDAELEATTVSEAIARERDCGILSNVTPGSWINANFNVWIGAPEDNRSWDYLVEAREFYAEHAPAGDEPARTLAYEELLIAEGSDWNWWYGPEHHSANDADFDELYRKHLSNVYHALGATPPEALARPIAAGAVRPYFVPQTAYVHPDLDRPPRYFDWLGAAMYVAERTTSAMHGREFLLDSLQAGIDEQFLYLRLHFAGGKLPAKEGKAPLDLVISAEAAPPGSLEADHWLRTNVRLAGERAADLDLAYGEGALPRDAQQQPTVSMTTAGPAPGARYRLRDSLELRLPLEVLNASPGGKIRVRASLWRDGLPVDALPVEGWVEVDLLTESELAAMYY